MGSRWCYNLQTYTQQTMNFKESAKIKAIIEKSKKVLLMIHQSPDPDSIVSNILISRYLDKIGKNWDLYCVDEVPERFKKIYKLDSLNDGVDPNLIQFSNYDLFLALDVNQPSRFGLGEDVLLPLVVNIDHHYTENKFVGVKVNDHSYSSASEMVYYLMEDFKFKLEPDDANLVLMGILTDTESFSYGTTPRLFMTVSKLLELGAEYDKVDEIIYRNNTTDQIKYWSKALENVKVDKKYKFAYTTLDIKTIKKYPNVLQASRTIADKFIRTISGTNFGMVMTETEEGYLKISVRSRSSSFGVKELLKNLNGGGHLTGGGGRIDLPFDKAVKKTIKIARSFAVDFPNGSK